MLGDKTICKDIRQSMLCSARLETSSGLRNKGVPTNNQRGRGSGPCLLRGGLNKSRHIVPTALLVRVQCFRKDLYKAVEGPSTRPIVLSVIIGQYCRRRRCLTIQGPDGTKFASHLTLLTLYTTCRSPLKTGWEIASETYSWNDSSLNLEKEKKRKKLWHNS